MRRIMISIALVVGLVLGNLSGTNALANGDKGNVCSTSKHTNSDIVDTAIAAGSFKTLVAAVKAAGLVDALKGNGPFTVFAPTDEAFAKLPKGTVESLLRHENRDKLVKILTYHVVPGNLKAADVVSLNGAKTLEGGLLKFSANGSNVHINNSKVVKADIVTSNGVIHVVDTVILPK